MKKIWIFGFGTLFLVLSLAAVVPQKFELTRMDAFLEGKFEGVSISYDGYLSLAPKDESIEGPPEEFYLSFLFTSEGIGFLGTGHSGKIYRVSEEGKVEPYFKVPEMDIYCLVQGPRGNIYAGSSPNGKIYKITEEGKGDVFFDPPEKYIWDLMISGEGSLLAAVGERGGIYRVNLEGEGRKILEAEENHILCMKENSQGDLIAGSGGQGLIYRITQSGKTSVLFESPYEEIKSISLDENGYIYAAAGGEVKAAQKGKAVSLAEKAQTDVSITVKAAPEKAQAVKPTGEAHPSTLYRISPQKTVQTLWHSENELIYSVSWDSQEKKALLGTGNKGRIYTVDLNKKTSLLLQKSSQQVYSFYPSDSGIYVISNNPSSLSLLSHDQRFDGEYVSGVLDARTLSKWGKISWEAEVPSGTTLQFQTRSGNSGEPNKAWSEWSPPYQKTGGEQILSPKGRYLQFKIMFKSQSGKVSPVLRELSLFYLQNNVSPRITKLELLPPNEVYLKPPPQEEKIWGVEEELSRKDEKNKSNKNYTMGKKVQQKGFQTVVWNAVDKNQDSLLYNLYIKEENRNQWRILKKDGTQEIFAFDTLSFPDGVYEIKLEASDSPDNPEGMELKDERISRSFVIDNSLPRIEGFEAVQEKNQLEVNFAAVDSLSYIKEVKYLVRPRRWKSVFPEDGICDSREERFRFKVSLSSESHNLITVKIKDSQGNVGVHRETF